MIFPTITVRSVRAGSVFHFHHLHRCRLPSLKEKRRNTSVRHAMLRRRLRWEINPFFPILNPFCPTGSTISQLSRQLCRLASLPCFLPGSTSFCQYTRCQLLDGGSRKKNETKCFPARENSINFASTPALGTALRHQVQSISLVAALELNRAGENHSESKHLSPSFDKHMKHEPARSMRYLNVKRSYITSCFTLLLFLTFFPRPTHALTCCKKTPFAG